MTENLPHFFFQSLVSEVLSLSLLVFKTVLLCTLGCLGLKFTMELKLNFNSQQYSSFSVSNSGMISSGYHIYSSASHLKDCSFEATCLESKYVLESHGKHLGWDVTMPVSPSLQWAHFSTQYSEVVLLASGRFEI